MTLGRGAPAGGAAGGPARHIPVLLDDISKILEPKPDRLFLDGTFGAGGYTSALLAAGARVVATDRDPDALAAGRALEAASGGRLVLIEAKFSEIFDAVRRAGFVPGDFDGVVFDIGVSSMQLDEADRGFSFRRDGPLDMRMSRAGRSAAQIVNFDEEERLADIFFHYGEERAARPIARAIVRRRAERPFETTLDLAGVVAAAVPKTFTRQGRPSEIHPATRVFQALRIAVNDELGELLAALSAGERLLAREGRLVVVSFHSLEDRIVKQFLAERSGRGRAVSRLLPGEPQPPEPSFRLGSAHPIAASDAETSGNPRSRSAKLRFGLRTGAPARAIGAELESLASLPSRQPRRR